MISEDTRVASGRGRVAVRAAVRVRVRVRVGSIFEGRSVDPTLGVGGVTSRRHRQTNSAQALSPSG